MPPVPVGFDEEAETGSVDETPVGRETDPVPVPVPGADEADVPFPYGAELEEYGGRPPVPVPVPGRDEDDDGPQGTST